MFPVNIAMLSDLPLARPHKRRVKERLLRSPFSRGEINLCLQISLVSCKPKMSLFHVGHHYCSQRMGVYGPRHRACSRHTRHCGNGVCYSEQPPLIKVIEWRTPHLSKTEHFRLFPCHECILPHVLEKRTVPPDVVNIFALKIVRLLLTLLPVCLLPKRFL